MPSDNEVAVPRPPEPEAESDDGEQRMRQALERMSEPARGSRRAVPERVESQSRRAPATLGHHKSRFVQDGEVPVVMMNGRPGRPQPDSAMGAAPERSRVAELEAAWRTEHAAREQAERTLREAQASLHELKTRLGHAELARDEAIEAERAAREELTAVQALMPPPILMRTRTVSETGTVPAEPLAERRPARVPTGRPRGRPRTRPLPDDPQPVKWWLPRTAPEEPAGS